MENDNTPHDDQTLVNDSTITDHKNQKNVGTNERLTQSAKKPATLQTSQVENHISYELETGDADDDLDDDDLNQATETTMLVAGIGGCGSNMSNILYKKNPNSQYVKYACINTDKAHLRKMETPIRVLIGGNYTKGQGAGITAEVGKEAAKRSNQKLASLFTNYDMILLVAGLGKGTGTGATPEIIQIINEVNPNAVIVVVVTTPFAWEGERNAESARNGLAEIRALVNSLIEISNARLAELYPDQSALSGYEKPNEFIESAIATATSAIEQTGKINADFADVRTILSYPGKIIIGKSDVLPVTDMTKAFDQALRHPLVSDTPLRSARGILVYAVTDENCPSGQLHEVLTENVKRLDKGNLVSTFGHAIDPSLRGRMYINLIVSGINTESKDKVGQLKDGGNASLDINKAIGKTHNNKMSEKRKKHKWQDENGDFLLHDFLDHLGNQEAN